MIKVKTSRGIKRFQQDKEIGNWFGRLLSILSSAEVCQPQQAIETGRKAPETDGKETTNKQSHDTDDLCEEEASQCSSSRSSDGASNAKRKYVPTPRAQTEMKKTMNALKTLASDTSSN